MARNTLSMLILIISLAFSNQIRSQCENVLLTTQADVDNYFSSLSCPTIAGQLDKDHFHFMPRGDDPYR